MVRYRRSKKVGPFRFTLTQAGISTSVGAGPLRVTRSANGTVRRTVRVPGTGVYDTKVVGGATQRPRPTAADPVSAHIENLAAELVKLAGFLLLFGIIVSALTGSVAVGFGVVGVIVVGLLVALAGLTVKLTRRQTGPSEQPSPEPETATLEAEAQTAEAEARAAAARARAIRLQIESLGNAKPAPGPRSSGKSERRRSMVELRTTAEAKPSQHVLASATELQIGDRVKVVAPADKSYLKDGTVTQFLNGNEVKVKLGTLSGTYTYSTDELQFLNRPIRW